MKHSISRILHPGLAPVTQSGVKPAVVKHGNTRPTIQPIPTPIADPGQDRIKNLETQNADYSRRLNEATTQLNLANQQIVKLNDQLNDIKKQFEESTVHNQKWQKFHDDLASLFKEASKQ